MNRMMLGAATLLAASFVCEAQSGKPITSLPQAQGDTLTTASAGRSAAPEVGYVAPVAGTPIPAMGSDVVASAEGVPAATVETQPLPESPSSSSVSSTAEMSSTPLREGVVSSGTQGVGVLNRKPHFGPGSAIGVQLKFGFAGGGIDLATPLAQRLNLRVGASYFEYNGSYDIDGMHTDGTAIFRSATVQVDVFPFGNGFRVSPGVTVYNGNSLNANLSVPGGQSFSLGDSSYTSSTTDPVHGKMGMTFGERTAPSLTVGWGNMIPRSNKHLSFPFEIGVQYIKDPRIQLNLVGSACQPYKTVTVCAPLATNAEAQQDLQNEESDLNSDIRPLRFYPIVSFGVAWAFHLGKH